MPNIETITNNIIAEIGTLVNAQHRNLLITTLLQAIHNLSDDRMEFMEALNRMLDSVDYDRAEAGEPPIDRRVGSVQYDQLAPMAAEIENLQILKDIFTHQSRLTTGTGITLDRIGADNSIPRREAVHAIRIAETWNTDGELMDFPLGIVFFEPETHDPMSYELIDTEGGVAKLKALTPGERGHSFFGRVIPTMATNNLGRCEIIGTEIPGMDRELDSRYRMRLINHLARPMFGGNIWQYRKWFEETEGVGNTVIYPTWLGGSTSKVVVLDGGYNPVTDEFLEQLQEIFDPYAYPSGAHGLGNGHPEKGLPIGHELTLVTPEEIDVTISVTVVLRPNVTIGHIEHIFNQRVEDYIQEVRQSYVAEWEDVILRGDGVRLQPGIVVDGTINDNDTNYIVDIHHQIGIFMARISALLIDTRLIANVTNVTINGLSEDFILEQDKYVHTLPRLLGGLEIITE